MSDPAALPKSSETSTARALSLRRIILNIHMYGGLLCFSYLILFGISVLNFNHPFPFTRSPAGVTTWARPMDLSAVQRTDGKSAAESQTIRRQNNAAILRAMGSFAGPFTDADGAWVDAETYHARFARPGKVYEIDARPARGSATIMQTRTGFWAMARYLHGASAVYPDSFFASTWRWYTDLCVFVVVAATASGVYLWLGRRRDRRLGLAVLGAATLLSLAVMLLVSLRG